MKLNLVKALLLSAATTLAHRANSVKPSDLSWQEWHMKEEHRIDNFDASAFFELHDIHGKGYWTPTEILYIYGLTRDAYVGDGSGMGEHDHEETISQEVKDRVVGEVSVLLRADSQGNIKKESWMEFFKEGGVLPDFGLGPGHHLDFEAEYENHHWNEYHKNQDPDVLIKHKEDIEHEMLHHEHEIEEVHDASGKLRAKDYVSPVRIQNIPQKYLA